MMQESDSVFKSEFSGVSTPSGNTHCTLTGAKLQRYQPVTANLHTTPSAVSDGLTENNAIDGAFQVLTPTLSDTHETATSDGLSTVPPATHPDTFTSRPTPNIATSEQKPLFDASCAQKTSITQYAFDIETMPNYFLAVFKDVATGTVYATEIRGGTERLEPADAEKVRSLLATSELVGFNSFRFDLPVLDAALNGWTCEQICNLATRLIKAKNGGVKEKTWAKGLRTNLIHEPQSHIDVQAVHPKFVGLKTCEAMLGMASIRELPVDPETVVTAAQMEQMRGYCEHDVDATIELLNHEIMQARVETRRTINTLDGFETVKSLQLTDPEIAEEFMRANGVHKSNVAWVGKTFSAMLPDNLEFSSKALADYHAFVTNHQYCVGEDGKVIPEACPPINVGGTWFAVGIGGLHSVDAGIIERNVHYLDVSSFYPSIILALGLSPTAHWGDDVFTRIYQGIVDKRLAAKDSGDTATSQVLKIVINGSYGKLGNPFSCLYNPRMLASTTLSGQLLLLELINKLHDAGITVVSANTDGLVVSDSCEAVVSAWEHKRGIKLDHDSFDLYVGKDVDNVFALGADGKVDKAIGDYRQPSGLDIIPDGWIINKAVRDNLAYGTPVMDTVNASDNIHDFVFVTTLKVDKATWRGQETGKVNRWVWTTDGEPLLKVSNGNLVPKGSAALSLLDLPNELPATLDRKRYADAASEKVKEFHADPQARKLAKVKKLQASCDGSIVDAGTGEQACIVQALTDMGICGKWVGGEYHSACPMDDCPASEDGFYILDSGRFFCRQCLPKWKGAGERVQAVYRALGLDPNGLSLCGESIGVTGKVDIYPVYDAISGIPIDKGSQEIKLEKNNDLEPPKIDAKLLPETTTAARNGVDTQPKENNKSAKEVCISKELRENSDTPPGPVGDNTAPVDEQPPYSERMKLPQSWTYRAVRLVKTGSESTEERAFLLNVRTANKKEAKGYKTHWDFVYDKSHPKHLGENGQPQVFTGLKHLDSAGKKWKAVDGLYFAGTARAPHTWVIAEGGKCADAAREVLDSGYLVTAVSSTAGTVTGTRLFTVLRQGGEKLKTIIFCPDNDKAGKDCAARTLKAIAEQAHEQQASIEKTRAAAAKAGCDEQRLTLEIPDRKYAYKLVDVAHLNAGGDIADVTPGAAYRLIQDAKPYAVPDGDTASAATDEAAAKMWPPVEPWAHEVTGAGMLDEIEAIFATYVSLPVGGAALCAVWSISTWLHGHPSNEISTFLNITSPDKRCGKSTLLEVLSEFVYRPFDISAAPSEAALYRSVSLWQPTFLLDEVDRYIKERPELTGLINGSQKRSNARTIRCVGKNFIPTPFITFCPKALAGIKDLPSTITDRSIVLRLVRTAIRLPRYRTRNREAIAQLDSKMLRWATDNGDAVMSARNQVVLPDYLNDRAMDAWELMFAIAHVAGGSWPEKIRSCCDALSKIGDATVSRIEQVASDVFTTLDDFSATNPNATHIASMSLLQKIQNIAYQEDRAYPDWFDSNRLARDFKSLDQTLKPGPFKLAGKTTRGYRIQHLRKACLPYAAVATSVDIENGQVKTNTC